VALLLSRRNVQSYLPLAPRLRQWKDRKKTVELPMFPSYVFARFPVTDMHLVLSTPGMATIVSVSGKPVPIADEEIANVRRFADAIARGGIAATPRRYIETGQWVRIRNGPLQGVTAIVLERRNRKRVLVGLKAIGQGLEVDVDTNDLDPIPAP
jgi:transcription antitermination factor NusG